MAQGYLKIIVLKKLSEKDYTGYSLMNEIGKELGKKPSSGSIYPLLAELEEKNYISCKENGNKKVYSITKKSKEKISNLLKEKEKLISRNIGIVKEFGEIIGHDRVVPLMSFLRTMHESPNDKACFFTPLSNLKDTIMRLLGYEKLKKKEEMEVIKILKDANEKLKKIENQYKK